MKRLLHADAVQKSVHLYKGQHISVVQCVAFIGKVLQKYGER